MVKIIADTSTMFSPKEGEALGIDIIPLSVSINHESYAELVEMDSETFLKKIKEGGVPSSSQPPIGKLVEAFEKYPNDEILGIFMCDGLSGTYQSAVSASQMVSNQENISIIDSKTLCGPHRYLVLKAKRLADEGKSKAEILEALQGSLEENRSFLLPQDFDFLKRGGRLTPIAAPVGGLLKIVPIMTQTEDRKRLEKHGIGRTFTSAVSKLFGDMERDQVDENTYITISHGGVLKQAETAASKIKEKFPTAEVEIFELTPAFITQGGPECVAIQWIKK